MLKIKVSFKVMGLPKATVSPKGYVYPKVKVSLKVMGLPKVTFPKDVSTQRSRSVSK